MDSYNISRKCVLYIASLCINLFLTFIFAIIISPVTYEIFLQPHVNLRAKCPLSSPHLLAERKVLVSKYYSKTPTKNATLLRGLLTYGATTSAMWTGTFKHFALDSPQKEFWFFVVGFIFTRILTNIWDVGLLTSDPNLVRNRNVLWLTVLTCAAFSKSLILILIFLGFQQWINHPLSRL